MKIYTIGNNEITIFHIASWFIYNIPRIVYMKLCILTYYTYAWYLALYNDSIIEHILFKDKFHALINAPENIDLYNWLYTANINLNRSLPVRLIFRNKFDLLLDNTDERLTQLLQDIAYNYGEYDEYQLSHMIHTQDVPWQLARRGLQPWQTYATNKSNIIQDDDIFNFYSSRLIYV